MIRVFFTALFMLIMAGGAIQAHAAPIDLESNVLRALSIHFEWNGHENFSMGPQPAVTLHRDHDSSPRVLAIVWKQPFAPSIVEVFVPQGGLAYVFRSDVGAKEALVRITGRAANSEMAASFLLEELLADFPRSRFTRLGKNGVPAEVPAAPRINCRSLFKKRYR